MTTTQEMFRVCVCDGARVSFCVKETNVSSSQENSLGFRQNLSIHEPYLVTYQSTYWGIRSIGRSPQQVLLLRLRPARREREGRKEECKHKRGSRGGREERRESEENHLEKWRGENSGERGRRERERRG